MPTDPKDRPAGRPSCRDPVVDRSRDMVAEYAREPGLEAAAGRLDRLLVERSEIGIVKYGTPLANDPKPLPAKLEHAIQEFLDGMNYLNWTGLERHRGAAEMLAMLVVTLQLDKDLAEAREANGPRDPS